MRNPAQSLAPSRSKKKNALLFSIFTLITHLKWDLPALKRTNSHEVMIPYIPPLAR